MFQFVSFVMGLYMLQITISDIFLSEGFTLRSFGFRPFQLLSITIKYK